MPQALPFDVNAFIEKHKTALSAEEINSVNELSKGYMAGSDYQRNMNKLKKDYADRVAEEDRLHNELKGYEQEHQELLELKEVVEQKFGDIAKFKSTADPNTLRTPSGDLVARKDVETLQSKVLELASALTETRGQLANFATGSLGLIAKLPSISENYRERYKRSFDGVKFMEFIQENNISDVDSGYKLFVLDDEQKFIEEKHKADLVNAREEGAREFATKHRIPEDHGVRRGLLARHDVPLVKPQPNFQAPPVAPPAAPPVAPSNTVASTSTRLNDAVAATENLRSNMQQRFLEAKDK